MTDSVYPPLRLGLLQALLALRAEYEQNEDVLDPALCPYGEETLDALKKLFEVRIKKEIVEKVVEKKRARGRPHKGGDLTDEQAAEIEDTATGLLEELEELKNSDDGEGERLSTKEKLDIIKTRANLIEKLVSMRERFFNIKEVGVFQAKVLQVLDDLVTEDGREEFLRRVGEYRA